MLQRQTDCSLTYGNYVLSGTSTAPITTVSSLIPNYEKIIHANAFLTTTPDQFLHGCTTATQGANSAAAIYLGKTKTNGSYLGATVSGNSIVIFTVSSGFNLAPLTSLIPDIAPFTIVGGDLNKDGNVDLLSINTDGINSSVSVFINNGDGTYKTPVNYEIPNVVASFGVVDDMNADGNADLVVGTGDGTSFQYLIYLGKGDGTFAAAVPFAPGLNNLIFSNTFITADVNGDGAKDIISSQGQVFLGTKSGTTFTRVPQAAFPAVDSATNGLAPGIVAADFDNDGKLDLATDDGATIRTYLGKGDGTFTIGNAYATIANRGLIIGADIDGDGNVDLYSGFGNSGVYAGDDFLPNTAYALMGNGDGTFQGAPQLPFKYTGTNLLDLNNDGRPDTVGLITGATQTTLTTFLTGSNGVPVAGPQLIIPSGVGVDSYALGAFNTNSSAVPGLLYLTASPQVQTFNLALGAGDGSFQAPTSFPVPTLVPTGIDINESLTGLRTGDFNHDGKLDIAYSFSDQANDTQIFYEGFAVQLGNGDGTFQAPKIALTYQSLTAPQVFPSNMLSGIADVNKDNFPDVFMVVPNGITNGELGEQVLLFVGNGDGTFKAPNTLTLTPNIRPSTPNGDFGSPFAFADLNGDGKLDLVASGSSLDGTIPQLAIALGNGDGTFKPPTILVFQGFGFPSGPALANFTGGGKMDLYVDGAGAGTSLGIFPGNGNGTFQTISNGDGTVSPPQQIVLSVGGGAAAVDFNTDGLPDLIAGNTVLLNESGAVVPGLAVTTVAVTSSLNPSTTGASVTFTATVTSATAGTITGSATFFDGSASLGAGTLNGAGVATFTTSTLAVGSHSITAQYGGDANFATSTSTVLAQVVNGAALTSTTTTVTGPTAGNSGGSFTFISTVAPTSGGGKPTGTLTILDGGNVFATGTVGSSDTISDSTTLSAGAHSITTHYSGDANFSPSTSTVLAVNVSATQATSTTTAVTGPATATAGASVSFMATVAPSSGSKTPTGSVRFVEGGSVFGTFTLNATGVATFSTSALSVGTHMIAAQYGGDPNFSSSTAGAFSINVTAAGSFTLSVAPSSVTVTAAHPGMATVTVTPANGFNQQVQFSCTGAPEGIDCEFEPHSVTPNGGPVTTMLAVTEEAESDARARKSGAVTGAEFRNGDSGKFVWPTRGIFVPVLGCELLVLAGIWRRRKVASARAGLQVAFTAMLLVTIGTFIGGCSGGGHGHNVGGTITIVGTGPNNQTATVPIAVTIQR